MTKDKKELTEEELKKAAGGRGETLSQLNDPIGGDVISGDKTSPSAAGRLGTETDGGSERVEGTDSGDDGGSRRGRVRPL